MSLLDDHQQVIRLFRHGHKQVWEEVEGRYGDAMRKFAFRLVGRDREKAADVVQDAMLAAYEDRHTLDLDSGQGGLRSWLFGIVFNRARRVWWDQWCERVVERLSRIEHPAAPTADPTPYGQSRERLAMAIDRLPAAQKDVLVLYYHAGLSAKDIAGVLGRQEGGVRQSLTDIRQKLFDRLSPEVS